MIAECALILCGVLLGGQIEMHDIEFIGTDVVFEQGVLMNGVVVWQTSATCPVVNCSVGCPQVCAFSPCSVAFADPARGNVMLLRMLDDRGANLFVNESLEVPVVCP